MDFLETKYRYEVYYGGAGSGKSVFIAQKYIYRILKRKLLNLLVVRQTGDTNRDSTFALLKQVINKWNLKEHFKVNESDMRITCKLNGNAIIFKGLDDTEKLKSITFAKGELTDVWIEEASEVQEQSFNQLDVRLRGGKDHKQITISFNPVDINNWLKKFVDKKQDNKMCLHTTYKHNKFLDAAYTELLESYKDTDPYYYDVYCRGIWGVLGQSIFDKNKVSARLTQIMETTHKTGQFEYDYVDSKIVDESIKWVDDPLGYINIYEDVKKGYPYVIGGDTAGDGSDNFVGQVIDNTTGKQVAKLRHKFDEDLYAQQMYCLGKHYNYALLGIEANYSTHPIKELERLGYRKQYIREKEDIIGMDMVSKYGFMTTTVTRPIIIAALVAIARESTHLFNDVTTLEEMLTFARNGKKKGRPEAAEGAHDDCVMAMAITYYIRNQQKFEAEIPLQKRKNSQWTFNTEPKGDNGIW